MTNAGPPAARPGYGPVAAQDTTNLGDILERVLDRGIVIVGDIRISLLDIELLTIKLRLLVASVDTARQLGIDWWEHDPWLTSAGRRAAVEEGAAHREQIAAGEAGHGEHGAIPASAEAVGERPERVRERPEAEEHG